MLSVCAAPELHRRYGFLYAYLQDDVTRRLASPRLVADLLDGEGVDRADVLDGFGPAARLSRAGALRLLQPDGPIALADRPVKVSDRLAAFLLGADDHLADAGAPAALRRVDPQLPVAGRHEVVAEVARLLAADTRAAAAGLRAGRGRDRRAGRRAPLLLFDVARPRARRGDGRRDARRRARASACSASTGLDDLKPPERARLLQAIDERRERTVVSSPHARAEALALSDRTALLVDVPMPSLRRAPRRVGASSPASADPRDVAAKFRLSIDQIGAAAEVSRIAARSRGATRPTHADLDLGARYASVSSLGELAARLDHALPLGRPRAARPPARPAALDLRLSAPPRPRPLRLGLRAARSPAPRG